jgi:hypothetical protein
MAEIIFAAPDSEMVLAIFPDRDGRAISFLVFPDNFGGTVGISDSFLDSLDHREKLSIRQNSVPIPRANHPESGIVNWIKDEEGIKPIRIAGCHFAHYCPNSD